MDDPTTNAPGTTPARPQSTAGAEAAGNEPATLALADLGTLLDQAHAAMQADPANEQVALRFYRVLADTPLLVLLLREAQGVRIDPRVFDLDAGPVILAFDTADRLAALGQGPVPYAELPGRVIARHLADKGVSLGLNFGSGAASETLLPPEAVDWLAGMVDAPAPQTLLARPAAFAAPVGLPQALVDALVFTFDAAPGLAHSAFLAMVRYDDGRQAHMLAILGAHPGAEPALAQAVAEAIRFCGLDAAEIDVTFLSQDAAAATELARTGLGFRFPPEATPEAAQIPTAPGSDPDRPPKLR